MALSSARLPMTCVWPHAHVHTGSGVPQYRSRLTPQSMTLSRKLPMRPSLIVSGIQLTARLKRMSLSLTAVILMNQLSRA